MNISNKNIKTTQSFSFIKWLWVSYVLFLGASAFLGNTNFKSEKQQAGHYKTHKTFVQESRATHQPIDLSVFDLVEESDPTDDSTEDDNVEGDSSLFTLTAFYRNIPKNSFTNRDLFCQKRAFISLFLLHHSWKIPSA